MYACYIRSGSSRIPVPSGGRSPGGEGARDRGGAGDVIMEIDSEAKNGAATKAPRPSTRHKLVVYLLSRTGPSFIPRNGCGCTRASLIMLLFRLMPSRRSIPATLIPRRGQKLRIELTKIVLINIRAN